MPLLSILIPGRNEMFLSKTVSDLLSNIRGDTEIIVIADGNWPNPPIPDHPKVHLIYHSESVGQRAATNEAAKISRAKYLMKCDAHCSFDDGFDIKLMEAMQDDWCMVPVMRNLHIFNWLCKNGHRRYQGPSGPCQDCGEPTKMEIVWISKTNPQSTVYVFDPEPHFQYGNEIKKRPEYRKAAHETKLTETMSLQGSCFMVTREKYFELNLCDEEFGSWGSQGLEVAIKIWTSGGRVVCNHKTFYAHAFRTQGGDWGFPYPISGRQVERAKKRAKDIFFKSQWGPQQIRPLSWLVEKFWPTPYWKEEDLRLLKESEKTFFPINLPSPRPEFISPVVAEGSNPFPVGRPESLLVNGLRSRSTDKTSSVGFSPEMVRGSGEKVSIGTIDLTGIQSTPPISSEQIILERGEPKMEGVAAPRVVADDVIQLRNVASLSHGDRRDQPSVCESVNQLHALAETNLSVPTLQRTSSPDPALSNGVNLDLRKDSVNVSCGKVGDSEIIGVSHKSSSSEDLRLEPGECSQHSPDSTIITHHKPLVKAFVYYTDHRPDPKIMQAVQKQLLKCCNGHKIVSVSLHKPVDFGENITVDLQRGYLTMFKQILMGIEACDADIIFTVEHDVLYHQSHFSFVPPQKDKFYYDENRWFVDSATGRALFYNAMSTSMMCAYRDLLLEHYRKRVERVEKEGYSFRIGFEPGGHKFPRGIDNHTREAYFSEFPSIDIRHGRNLTVSRWNKDEFRNKGNLYAWKESDEIPGWGVVKGRFQEILDAI